MYSITLDPDVDRPDDLKEYAELFETGPGWTFLTGEFEDIELLRHKLGAWDRDPVIDQDKTQHAGLLVYGSEPIGRWAAMPGLDPPDMIVKALRRVVPSLADFDVEEVRSERLSK